MELIDVLNEKGEKTGEVVAKPEVHRLGLWHASAHIWILNSKGELLIQRRALEKETSPGCWDISVAGHLSAGDSALVGAVREFQEEIGISIESTELKFLGVQTTQEIHQNGVYINNEFEHVFLVKKDIPIESMVISKEEVMEVKYIPWRELKVKVEVDSETFVPHHEEYKLLFDYLEKNSL